ncbi:MAG: hypothetical protein ABSD82_11700, partial [Solirubrobacteraceae bacterium]
EALQAPQEAAAWEWAIDNAIEPATVGLKRHMFRLVWHYVLGDIGNADPGAGNAEMFAPADAPVWVFLASLDEQPERLLYEAAKLTARADRDPFADL